MGGLVHACLFVFMGLMMLNYLDYIKKLQENNYIEWDVKTITSGDYTIEFALEPEFFKTWVNKEFLKWAQKQKMRNNKEYVARVEAFRDWI